MHTFLEPTLIQSTPDMDIRKYKMELCNWGLRLSFFFQISIYLGIQMRSSRGRKWETGTVPGLTFRT